METRLACNIRAHRKARALTQEQLAEMLGVTVGAVHKWETKLSVPELPMIMEMADFFDTSVDALLGYELRDNRLGATEERLWQYHRDKDPQGISEAEKALKKYPNAFNIAYASARIYHGIGMEIHDRAMLCRALELYGKARQLLSQNRNATINEQSLSGDIAQVWFALGEKEKAVDMIRAQNADNHYSAVIGELLATELDRPDEALPYLGQGLMRVFNDIIYTAVGFASVYRARRDHGNGQAILEWSIRTLRGLKQADKPDFIDKLSAVFCAYLAAFQLDAGDADAARESVDRALALARGFDAAPDYSYLNVRFISEGERTGTAYDILGATALQAVENAIRDADSPALTALLRERQDNIQR